MRRLSTLSALTAALLAITIGYYVTHGAPVAKASTQPGFSPNSLLIESSLKTESWDCF